MRRRNRQQRFGFRLRIRRRQHRRHRRIQRARIRPRTAFQQRLQLVNRLFALIRILRGEVLQFQALNLAHVASRNFLRAAWCRCSQELPMAKGR